MATMESNSSESLKRPVRATRGHGDGCVARPMSTSNGPSGRSRGGASLRRSIDGMTHDDRLSSLRGFPSSFWRPSSCGPPGSVLARYSPPALKGRRRTSIGNARISDGFACSACRYPACRMSKPMRGPMTAAVCMQPSRGPMTVDVFHARHRSSCACVGHVRLGDVRLAAPWGTRLLSRLGDTLRVHRLSKLPGRKLFLFLPFVYLLQSCFLRQFNGKAAGTPPPPTGCWLRGSLFPRNDIRPYDLSAALASAWWLLVFGGWGLVTFQSCCSFPLSIYIIESFNLIIL